LSTRSGSQGDPDRVTVIGLDGGPLPERALAALARASLVVGWPQQVDLVRHLVPPVTELVTIDRGLRAELDVVAAAQGSASSSRAAIRDSARARSVRVTPGRGCPAVGNCSSTSGRSS
jgi:hypothetical protein